MNDATSVGYVGRAATPEPERSPVQESIHGLVVGQNVTHDLINELETRLESVLTPKQDAKTGPNGLIRNSHSSLHSLLNDRLDHCDGHNARLRAILERLTI